MAGSSSSAPLSEPSYDIPLDQIVGSTIETEYSVQDGTPHPDPHRPGQLHRQRPRQTRWHLARHRPAAVLAFGNSDGDYQMLQYTTAGDGPRIGLLLHHDDAEREFAYDRDSMIGRLDKGLVDASANGWHIVSMKDDFAEVFRGRVLRRRWVRGNSRCGSPLLPECPVVAANPVSPFRHGY